MPVLLENLRGNPMEDDMKKKISITLSLDLRAEIDRLIAPNGSRSAFIEKVLSDHFERLDELEIPSREVSPANIQSCHE
jgi:hypothetical protein